MKILALIDIDASGFLVPGTKAELIRCDQCKHWSEWKHDANRRTCRRVLPESGREGPPANADDAAVSGASANLCTPPYFGCALFEER